MLLLEKAQVFFAPTSRRRGHEYARQGRVAITETSENVAGGVVRGTAEYRVTVAFDGRALRVRCTCRHARAFRDPCAHIWAMLLIGAQRGIFPELAHEDDLDAGWAASDAWTDDLPDFHDRVILTDDRAPEAPRRRMHWRALVSSATAGSSPSELARDTARGEGEILYVVDAAGSASRRALVVQVMRRKRVASGAWGRPRSVRIRAGDVEALGDADDRRVLAALVGARQDDLWSTQDTRGDRVPSKFELTGALSASLVPIMCASGRCRLRRQRSDRDPVPLTWDAGGVWELWLDVTRLTTGTPGHGRARVEHRAYVVDASIRRGEDRLHLDVPDLIVEGLVVIDGRAAALGDGGAVAWAHVLRREGPIEVQGSEAESFVSAILAAPSRPRLDLPEELRVDEVRVTPRPRLTIGSTRGRARTDWLTADLAFDYDGVIVAYGSSDADVVDMAARRVVVRDADAERRAVRRLHDLPLGRARRTGLSGTVHGFKLRARDLSEIVRALVPEDWRVEASGRRVRSGGAMSLGISSGIDWFELRGEVRFGEQSATLPELLAAIQRGEHTVTLGDGSVGLLPEQWLRRHAVLADLGTLDGDHVRFRQSQAALLDALLAAQPDTTFDEGFDRARRALAGFAGVRAADAPAGFVGTLRDYQREGLGWMGFLADFGLGGCLADDMGLGKTVQVLALLESRRRRGPGVARKPSLVVVPRSLMFNWKDEAAHFTPQLTILDHTGTDRTRTMERLADYDVVLTTYGTLRRDAARLMRVEFDYVVLDEAQAIKNASTASAKAVRLLQGDHRLALSGTPIENHLGEIWSLFEFLNPGILGSAAAFRALESRGTLDGDAREVIARALRPLILRRTKAQVATELPDKIEQSLYCELPPKQRKLYDELRDHYRAALDDRIAAAGLGRSKILVLEALLRLRQAACHPGLVDGTKVEMPSAKVDLLLDQLTSVVDEGHKALVFSQFTSLLAIVRKRLDPTGIAYAYLDGRTRARQAEVDRFQTDPDCKLFLISLKAGGLGLNLTAAEYVYLLDPWWNPAVEAQAIDRTHRIGQTRHVFAYRLVAKDTVEEKILELQTTKRELADSIIRADNALVRDLGRDDLELLLS